MITNRVRYPLLVYATHWKREREKERYRYEYIERGRWREGCRDRETKGREKQQKR